MQPYILDSDDVRNGLSRDLGMLRKIGQKISGVLVKYLVYLLMQG